MTEPTRRTILLAAATSAALLLLPWPAAVPRPSPDSPGFAQWVMDQGSGSIPRRRARW
jgi:hypothetical protein